MEINIGERIISLRKRYGMSQYTLGKMTGIAQAALSQYEAGKKTPGIDTIQQLCDGLGISLSDFFEIDPDQDDPENAHIVGLTADENTLILSYRKLSGAQQQDLLAAVSGIVEKRSKSK